MHCRNHSLAAWAAALPRLTSSGPSGWKDKAVTVVRGSWPQHTMLLLRSSAAEGSDRSLHAMHGR